MTHPHGIERRYVREAKSSGEDILGNGIAMGRVGRAYERRRTPYRQAVLAEDLRHRLLRDADARVPQFAHEARGPVALPTAVERGAHNQASPLARHRAGRRGRGGPGDGRVVPA